MVQQGPPPRSEILNEVRFELKRDEESASFLNQRVINGGKPNHSATVQATNPRYGFKLAQTSPDNPWILNRIETDPSNSSPMVPSPEKQIEEIVTSPVTFYLILPELCDMTKDPGFTVKQVAPLSRDGRELVKVEFSFGRRRIRKGLLRSRAGLCMTRAVSG